MRKLRWQLQQRPMPKHPYRDTAFLYGGLAGVVLVIAAATGGNMVKAVIWAAAVFIAATAYSWWYWRDRLHKQDRGEK